LTKQEVLEIWAPSDSVWSRFTKPVLFSFMEEDSMYGAADFTRLCPIRYESGVVMLVDAPGSEGVAIGLSAAASGYRPIPLYNAVPFVVAYPQGEILSVVTIGTPKPMSAPAAVDLIPTMASLYSGAEKLSSLNLPQSAPPAFLLDSNRAGSGPFQQPGSLDNRSFVSPLDLPTAAFLNNESIDRLVLVQTGVKTQPDLLLILIEWQREGIQIFLQAPWQPWNPQPLKLKPPSLPARLLHQLTMALAYQRNRSGEFGRIVRSSG